MNKGRKLEITSKFNSLKEIITDTLKEETKSFSLEQMVMLWNRFSEDEKNGVDYMFNFNNKEDIISLLKCKNFNSHTLCDIVLDFKNKHDVNTSYFLYNDETMCYQSLSMDYILKLILTYIDEIVTCILSYPFVDEYKTFYLYFMTDVIIDQEL